MTTQLGENRGWQTHQTAEADTHTNTDRLKNNWRHRKQQTKVRSSALSETSCRRSFLFASLTSFERSLSSNKVGGLHWRAGVVTLQSNGHRSHPIQRGTTGESEERGGQGTRVLSSLLLKPLASLQTDEHIGAKSHLICLKQKLKPSARAAVLFVLLISFIIIIVSVTVLQRNYVFIYLFKEQSCVCSPLLTHAKLFRVSQLHIEV